MCSNEGMQCGPFKYLGAMISDGRVLVKDQMFIVEKANARLEGRLLKPGWQAGAAPVCSSSHSCSCSRALLYYFQLWKKGSAQGMHLVGWEQVKQPKAQGGLPGFFSVCSPGPYHFELAE